PATPHDKITRTRDAKNDNLGMQTAKTTRPKACDPVCFPTKSHPVPKHSEGSIERGFTDPARGYLATRSSTLLAFGVSVSWTLCHLLLGFSHLVRVTINIHGASPKQIPAHTERGRNKTKFTFDNR
ncbi:unnamed protein product, partial [Ectocarpus sp. 4 AP-2014]